MKKTLIIFSVALVALGMSLVVYIVLAQNPSKPIQNNVANTETKKPAISIVSDKIIEFRNDKGQLLKTISLKPETTAVGSDSKGEKIKITEKYEFVYSKNEIYLGLRCLNYTRYKNGNRVWPPEHEASVEYYNREGKLLWRKPGANSFSISDDGSRLAVIVPILSEKAKLGRYEEPEMEDPKYREQLIIIDSLGVELFKYETYKFSGVAGLIEHGKYGSVFLTQKYAEEGGSDKLIFSVDIPKTYIISKDTLKKYNTVFINNEGSIIFTKPHTDKATAKIRTIKQGSTIITITEPDTVRILKYGEWW